MVALKRLLAASGAGGAAGAWLVLLVALLVPRTMSGRYTCEGVPLSSTCVWAVALYQLTCTPVVVVRTDGTKPPVVMVMTTPEVCGAAGDADSEELALAGWPRNRLSARAHKTPASRTTASSARVGRQVIW